MPHGSGWFRFGTLRFILQRVSQGTLQGWFENIEEWLGQKVLTWHHRMSGHELGRSTSSWVILANEMSRLVYFLYKKLWISRKRISYKFLTFLLCSSWTALCYLSICLLFKALTQTILKLYWFFSKFLNFTFHRMPSWFQSASWFPLGMPKKWLLKWHLEGQFFTENWSSS